LLLLFIAVIHIPKVQLSDLIRFIACNLIMSFLNDLLESLEAGSASTNNQHQSVGLREYLEPKGLPQPFVYSGLYDEDDEEWKELCEGVANDREARLRLYGREVDLERRKQAHERALRLYAAEEARQIYARRKAAQRNVGSPASSGSSNLSDRTAPLSPLPQLPETLAPETSRPVSQVASDTNQAHDGARLSPSTSTVSKRKHVALGEYEAEDLYQNKKTKQSV
jgi:hypothetical protein